MDSACFEFYSSTHDYLVKVVQHLVAELAVNGLSLHGSS